MGRREGRRRYKSYQYALSVFSFCSAFSTCRYDVRVDPATTEELGTVPELGLAEAKEAINAASRAFKTWSKTTAKVRPYLVLSCFAS